MNSRAPKDYHNILKIHSLQELFLIRSVSGFWGLFPCLLPS